MMPPAVRSSNHRRLAALVLSGAAALVLAACGTEGISVPEDDPAYAGAELFAQRCSGCHTLEAAGAQGSGDRELRVQGPNLDQRQVDYEDALFAIRNGGFSGAIMPQNIVVGEEAESVAEFIAEYSGTDVEEPAKPGSDTE
jgi:mono/diheme cytochrome c family protein